ncbi:MAG: adenylate/guanylate cyclase domain-containing protein, partial [Brevinematales bacterium]
MAAGKTVMKTGFFLSIEFRIISLIIIVLLMTGIFMVYFMYYTQRSNLIASAERGLNLNTETLSAVLRNMMLDGRAPLLVKSLGELRDSGIYKDISIFRINGKLAFSDYKTLDNVNSRQKGIHFEKTPRIADRRSPEEFENTVKKVGYVIDKGSVRHDFLEKTRELEYYYPVLNLEECMRCHGSEFSYRGVIGYRLSLADTYSQIFMAGNVIILFFSSVALFLILILAAIFRSLIINPVKKIGKAVELLGNGDFTARCDLKRRDELGNLAGRINIMIKGLEERFKLSKYVSGSTRTQVERGDETNEIRRRENIIVLFSDVRGFTSYTESHKPEEVIENLNSILQIQAEAVEECGGDVDKFVGDEVMAVFEDSRTALECAFKMIDRVRMLGLGLEVGIGINSGEVLTGNIGSKNRREFAVIGDTVNLASRLCGLAKPGTILTTENYYRKVAALVEADI